MKQVEIKTALRQCKKFDTAYQELKELIREKEFWFVDGLEFYPDFIPVIIHQEYRVPYGELWLVFAELKFPEEFPKLKSYGFVIVDEVEDIE